MKHLVLTGDETPDDLRAAINNLRAQQRRAVIPSTAAEYAADVDELLAILFPESVTC